MRRATLILVPYLWLLALFLVPFIIVLKISLSDTALAIPPYTPSLDLSAGWQGMWMSGEMVFFIVMRFCSESCWHWAMASSAIALS